jgi:predicted ABC-class ATPase
MDKFRQPLNCREAIQLMNNLIHQTYTQERLAEFQRICSLGNNSFTPRLVTRAWCRGFLKRHKQKMLLKEAKKLLQTEVNGQPYPTLNKCTK